MTVLREMSTRVHIVLTLGLIGWGAGVSVLAGGFHACALCLLPLVIGLLLLALAGRERLARLLVSHRARPRRRLRPSGARAQRGAPRRVVRGGALIARALAGRAPPPLPS